MPGFEAAFGGRPMPALATTYEGGDPALLERLVELVDLLEIAPDTIVGSEQGQYVLRPEVLEEYASVSSRVGLIAHGIGLSIGWVAGMGTFSPAAITSPTPNTWSTQQAIG